MFGKYSRTAVCEQVKQIVNALKASEKFWRNNQVITACCVKVYQYEMIINEKLTMIGLIVEYCQGNVPLQGQSQFIFCSSSFRTNKL